ncbi:MAG: hypothetical protein HOV83_19480, partial [Catenulispora sp.]|nr:hypothetical protein [Catenulispora sp.]
MHDVTKRGLALAVATGSLLITGAAPAVSAVHAEHSDGAGTKSRLDDGSSGQAAQSAPISVSGSTVQQYEGRHKTSEALAAAAAASGRQWALAEHRQHHGNGEQRARLDGTPLDADHADYADYADDFDYGDDDAATT